MSVKSSDLSTVIAPLEEIIVIIRSIGIGVFILNVEADVQLPLYQIDTLNSRVPVIANSSVIVNVEFLVSTLVTSTANLLNDFLDRCFRHTKQLFVR